jgi:hypothetical protein
MRLKVKDFMISSLMTAINIFHVLNGGKTTVAAKKTL